MTSGSCVLLIELAVAKAGSFVTAVVMRSSLVEEDDCATGTGTGGAIRVEDSGGIGNSSSRWTDATGGAAGDGDTAGGATTEVGISSAGTGVACREAGDGRDEVMLTAPKASSSMTSDWPGTVGMAVDEPARSNAIDGSCSTWVDSSWPG